MAKRVDTTHGPIRDALRALGFLVHDVHELPGFVDLLAYHPRIAWGVGMWLIEVKTGAEKFTPAQERLIELGWPIVVLRSVEDATAWGLAVLKAGGGR